MSTDKKFPIESCREKIARRHGASAVALSGPCKGASLADCVCEQLQDRFEDVSRRFAGNESKIVRLATKLANSFMSEDDSKECLNALGSMGYSKQASAGITGYLEAYAMKEALTAELEGLIGDIESEDSDADEPIQDDALGDLVEEAPEDEGLGEDLGEGLGEGLGEDLGEGMGEGLEGLGEEIVDVVDVDLGDEGPGGSVSFEVPEDVVKEVLTPIIEEVVEEVIGGGVGEGVEDLGGDEMVEFEVIDDVGEGAEDMGSDVHEEREMDLIEGLEDLHDGPEGEAGVPGEETKGDIQIVEGGDGGDGGEVAEGGHVGEVESATCGECGKPKEANMTKVRVKIAYPEHGSGGHDASGGSNKKVEDPNAIADGNLVNDGYSAVGKKFQDGSTLGSEQPFDAATVEASDVSGGESSLQGEDESFPEGGPSVPAGSSPIKNEELTGGDVSTKGTVIATVTPDGIRVQTPDGKVLLAKTKIAKSQVTKTLLDAIAAIKFDGDGRKYAKDALLTFRKIAGKAEKTAAKECPCGMKDCGCGCLEGGDCTCKTAKVETAKVEAKQVEASITPEGIAFKIAGKAYLAKVAVSNPTKELVAALEAIKFDGDVRNFALAAVNAVTLTKTASEEGVKKTDTSKLEDSKFTNDDGPMEAEDQDTVGKNSPKSREDGITKIDTAEKEADHFQNTDYENEKVDSGGSKEAAAAKATKTADEKKVEDPKPIADGNLVNEGYSAVGKKFQDGSTMGAEKPFDAHKVEDSEVSGGTSSLMGEDESLPTDKPSVPAGSPSMGDEPWSGGDVSTKGTTIAENKAKVREARLKAASVYVADLLQHGDIEPNEYSETLEKTASMPVQSIQNLAFSTKKARARVAKTAEAREAIVKEASSQPGWCGPVVVASNNGNDLKTRLVNAFKLTQTLDDYDAMKEKN